MDSLALVTPTLSGFAMARLFPITRDDIQSPAVPPGWVFGMAWTGLYALIGLVWRRARQEHPDNSNYIDAEFIALTAALAGWVYVYQGQRDKKGALYIMLLCQGLTVLVKRHLASLDRDSSLDAYLEPLQIWLSFATTLNVVNV